MISGCLAEQVDNRNEKSVHALVINNLSTMSADCNVTELTNDAICRRKGSIREEMARRNTWAYDSSHWTWHCTYDHGIQPPSKYRRLSLENTQMLSDDTTIINDKNVYFERANAIVHEFQAFMWLFYYLLLSHNHVLKTAILYDCLLYAQINQVILQ